MKRDDNRKKEEKRDIFLPIQVKYAMSYLILLVLVLILLNTYPLISAQDLVFSTKENAMDRQAAVISSALMELDSLTPESVHRVMDTLDNLDSLDNMILHRILITDPQAKVLYDNRKNGDDALGSDSDYGSEPETETYALLNEIVTALHGRDVFCSEYVDGVFISATASPIVRHGTINGAIYMMEVDAEPGVVLRGLQDKLLNASVLVIQVAVVVGAVFSHVLTKRIGTMLKAVRIVGEGEYGHRLRTNGRDELSQLAGEFNALTDRLQATEEVRRRFVSDASHELKTPLAAIRLLADSILENESMEPELVRDFVSDIGSEADRLTRTAEDLLALSRLDNLTTAAAKPVEMGEVIDRAMVMLTPVAEAGGITVRVRREPDCLILCTEDDLYRVCFNLMENAIKYNQVGGTVDISLEMEDSQILMEVTDTGIGIPEEELPKVFNRFYRVDAARFRSAGGTGLGLSIARDTVRRYGGWIMAGHNDPKGSIFTVGFPRYIPEQGEV